jgi:hypothetical protein
VKEAGMVVIVLLAIIAAGAYWAYNALGVIVKFALVSSNGDASAK